MLVDEIWDFKSINMGRELEISGEFIYESAKKTMSITGLNNQYEINIILYTGAVGIERLQKIYLCLVLQNPTDKESVPKCLIEHNHHELEKEIEKYTTEQLSKNGRSLLGVFSNYYNNYRYANYIPGKNSSELRKLFISFLKKQNGRWYAFGSPYAGSSRIWRNECAPIKAIVFLGKDPDTDKCFRLEGVDAFRVIYSNLTMNIWNKEYMNKTMEFVQEICMQIPIFYLQCRPEKSATECLKRCIEKRET